jgi:hypothetical protein
MHQENVLTFHKFKYLKWSLGLIFICILLYLTDSPQKAAGGSTFLGYVLGTIGAILIVCLMLYGIRKRAYQSNFGTVRGWLSAHVYLGLSLVFIATLHSGFNFGLNIPTLTYALSLIVVATGMWGVAMYLSKPAIINTVLHGKTLEQAGEALIDLDIQSKDIASQLDRPIQTVIQLSAETPIFKSAWQRYFNNKPPCATAKAVEILTDIYTKNANKSGAANQLTEQLFTLQIKRQLQLNQIRTYLRHKGWNDIWLVFHVSLSFFLLGALIAHVISAFVYW